MSVQVQALEQAMIGQLPEANLGFDVAPEPGRLSAFASGFKDLLSQNVLEPVTNAAETLRKNMRRTIAIGSAALAGMGFAGVEIAKADTSSQPANTSGAGLVCVKPHTGRIPCAWDSLLASRQKALEENPNLTFTGPDDNMLHRSVLGSAAYSNSDPITKIKIMPAKSGHLDKIILTQSNCRENMPTAEFEDPNNPNATPVTYGLSIDCDMFVRKIVTFTPMLRNKHGKFVKQGESVRQKNWDNFSPTNLVRKEGEYGLQLHTSKTNVPVRFSSAAIRAGEAFMGFEQKCNKVNDVSYGNACRYITGAYWKVKRGSTTYSNSVPPPIGDVVFYHHTIVQRKH